MANGSAKDKAAKARRALEDIKYGDYTSQVLAKRNRTGKGLSTGEKILGATTSTADEKAAKLMHPRRLAERARTASRATFIASKNSPASKRAAAAKVTAALTGISSTSRKAAPKKTTVKKTGKK